MVRLRAAELLGGDGGGRQRDGGPTEAAQLQHIVVSDRVEPPADAPAWALQAQGAAVIALVMLDKVLQTGVVDRHPIEGKGERRPHWGSGSDERYRVGHGVLQPIATPPTTGAKALGYLIAVHLLRPHDPRLVSAVFCLIRPVPTPTHRAADSRG